MSNRIRIGINGLGRIGKCVLLQLYRDYSCEIKAINATKVRAHELEDYLSFDSVHGRHPVNVKVINDQLVKIEHHEISLISERDPSKIDWVKLGVDYLIDCTGAFLTKDKCAAHNAPFTIISSPAKDDMPTFIYGVNHNEYKGEKIVSGSSCTTNCLAPMLSLLDKNFGVSEAIFTTIHAATASQYVTDVLQKGVRTDRSIINNIIPHTTGASSSVTAVMPHLKGKVFGTSVRVPVSNCSLVDLNVTFKRKNVTLDMVEDVVYNSGMLNYVFSITNKKRVSSDYMTTSIPCNLDLDASMDLYDGKVKLFLWYDNEWSYSTQLIHLVQTMFQKNKELKMLQAKQEKFFSHYVESFDLKGKGVVCRFDYNVPVNKDGQITDDFRITSTFDTINEISKGGADYVVLVSHFGRPDGKDPKYSTRVVLPALEKMLNTNVTFLPDGISKETINILNERPHGIYLLENIRFHKEETLYETNPSECEEFAKLYSQLGDVFISDAFGCAHRKHFSVHGISQFGKPFGYGCLIKKEVEALSSLTNLHSAKVLGVIGGNKIKDKLPIIDSLKHLNNSTVFVAGGLARQYVPDRDSQKTNVIIMEDGVGSIDLNDEPEYVESIANSLIPVYDIGTKAMVKLLLLTYGSDIIFWNGSLGYIEDSRYRKGSDSYVEYLLSSDCLNKQIIIGGGETASLFNKEQLKEKKNIYVSTGGGALLEFLQNNILHKKTLVGLEIFY